MECCLHCVQYGTNARYARPARRCNPQSQNSSFGNGRRRFSGNYGNSHDIAMLLGALAVGICAGRVSGVSVAELDGGCENDDIEKRSR